MLRLVSHLSQISASDMGKPEQTSTPSGYLPTPTQPSFHQSPPSPSLCCACGLCIMLVGINITLVGVLAFGSRNITIIVGPLLLLVALAFFVSCCVSSRSRAHMVNGGKRGERWGRMQMGTVAFEVETSEHILQDTTAVPLSPTNSSSSSHKSNSSRGRSSPAWAWGRRALHVWSPPLQPVWTHLVVFVLKNHLYDVQTNDLGHVLACVCVCVCVQ